MILAMTMTFVGTFAQQVINLGANLEANSISNDGSIIAGSIGDSNFIWTPSEGMQIISTLTNGYPMAGRATVSGDGTKISATVTNTNTGLNEMGLYDVASETWTLLGGIAGSSDGSKSSAWAISNNGDVVGGLGWVNAGTAHGILWNETDGVIDLGSTVTERSTRVNALSADGSVVAGWQDGTTGFRQGAVWVDGVQTLIFDQDGIEVSEAGDISADGSWVVGGNGFEAYRWNADEGLHYISHPNSGMWYRGSSTAISADGSTVVGFYRSWPGPPTLGEGFIWTEATGRVELNEYVTSLGMDDLGITFSLPLGISDDGSFIIGMGISGANVVGFLIQLPVAPENNDCENAIALACGDSVEGSTTFATHSGGNSSTDVFYTYTGSGEEEEVTVSLCEGNTNFNTLIRVFTDCSFTEEIAFNDDECGEYSEITFISNGTDTYYIMVEGSDEEDNGDFTLEISCSPTMSIEDVEFGSLNYFPNPVTNVLNISSEQIIENIEVYNVSGQLVETKAINALQFQTDFSTFSVGTYFVKVTSGKAVKTFRIIKK